MSADALGLAELNVVSWRAAYTGIVAGHVLDDLSVPELVPQWRQRVDRPDTPNDRLWVVEDDARRIAGYCRTGPARDIDLDGSRVGEVYGMYTHPDVWGTGAAQAVFRLGVGDLAARGYSAAVLWVVEANDRARRFYEKEGFSFDGKRGRPFYGAAQVRYASELADR